MTKSEKKLEVVSQTKNIPIKNDKIIEHMLSFALCS